jgi:hypothetical protein
MKSNSCYSDRFGQVGPSTLAQPAEVRSTYQKSKYLIVAAIAGVLAMIATAEAAPAFPPVTAKPPGAFVCKYLLATKIMHRLIVEGNFEEVRRQNRVECELIPAETLLLATNSNGGSFVGVHIPSRNIDGWTFNGWVQGVK